MRQLLKFVMIIALTASLGACDQDTKKPARKRGSVSAAKAEAAALGTIGGSFVGAQATKEGSGTLLGAYLTNSIGASLNEDDMDHYNKAAQGALEKNKVGQTSTWSNGDTGNSGTITPTRSFQSASQQYCREYTQTVKVAGKTERAYGTACKQKDGSWKIVQ